MRIGKLTQAVLFGISIIVTIYAFYEGSDQYNQIKVNRESNLF